MKIKKENIKKIRVGEVGINPLEITLLEFGQGNNIATIVCGMHGNEYSGLHIVKKLVDTLDEKNLVGKIRIILNANPLAQALHTREVPKDNLDLNRIFPGDPQGDLANRIANKILHACLDATAVIDLHTFSGNCIPFGIYMGVGSEEIKQTSMKLLQAFNLQVVWKLNYTNSDETKMTGALCPVLMQKDIASFAVEMPEEDKISTEQIDQIVRSLNNVLVKMQILNNEDTSAETKLDLVDLHMIKTDVCGLYNSEITPGANVKKGQIIGRICTLPEMININIISPNEGVIVVNKARGFITTGDMMFCLGTKTK